MLALYNLKFDNGGVCWKDSRNGILSVGSQKPKCSPKDFVFAWEAAFQDIITGDILMWRNIIHATVALSVSMVKKLWMICSSIVMGQDNAWTCSMSLVSAHEDILSIIKEVRLVNIFSVTEGEKGMKPGSYLLNLDYLEWMKSAVFWAICCPITYDKFKDLLVGYKLGLLGLLC